MFGRISRWSAPLLAVMVSLMCLGVPSFAGVMIPSTGDGSGAMLPMIGGLLVISVILIIVYVVLSAKKKKR